MNTNDRRKSNPEVKPNIAAAVVEAAIGALVAKRLEAASPPIPGPPGPKGDTGPRGPAGASGGGGGGPPPPVITAAQYFQSASVLPPFGTPIFAGIWYKSDPATGSAPAPAELSPDTWGLVPIVQWQRSDFNGDTAPAILVPVQILITRPFEFTARPWFYPGEDFHARGLWLAVAGTGGTLDPTVYASMQRVEFTIMWLPILIAIPIPIA